MKAILFPGQGSQFRGMGRDLFPQYRNLAELASDILGYSIEKLCVDDPDNQLRLTQYTQPALYVVNALGYYRRRDEGMAGPDCLAGHSLGEYNALLAAGAFDFETGLRLVQRRGELMGAARNGGMAAVIGPDEQTLAALLREAGLHEIDLANFNTLTQTVIAGPQDAIARAEQMLLARDLRCVVLNVSAAFHSRYMHDAQLAFEGFLRRHRVEAPRIPVIANATARPYRANEVVETLARQIGQAVRWTDCVRCLMGLGCTEFVEIGGTSLTKMVDQIRSTATPLVPEEAPAPARSPVMVAAQGEPVQVPPPQRSAPGGQAPGVAAAPQPVAARAAGLRPETLGSALFRQRFGLRYAYVTGGMYRGIASPALVVRVGRAGMLGFFGTGGLPPADIEAGLRHLQSELRAGEPWGLNLLANFAYPEIERQTVELYLRHGVRFVEAAAFMQISPALVLFRLKGLKRGADGHIGNGRRILAKLSRPEVAEAFMSPAPEALVQQLLKEGQITAEEAELGRHVPVSADICVEADSGGHTDGAIPTVLFPAMRRLRDQMQQRHGYAEPLCIGLAGGIGTPEAAAAAFMMGADFVLTGSINQCTVEAGTSDDVKSLLQDIDVQDTEYAPAGDMFETGAIVQVMKKGVFFPTRANKLFSLYTHYGSLDEIPEKTKKQLQGTYFRKPIDEVWEESRRYFAANGLQHEIVKAEANPKHKMALVFRWYFGYSSRLALTGEQSDRVNYQVHTGPALGAFNQWVKGTPLEPWNRRHADEIGLKLLGETADYLNRAVERLAQAA